MNLKNEHQNGVGGIVLYKRSTIRLRSGAIGNS
ncbi:hypothetical protein JOE49_001889 [Paenibacillus sp. PvR133]|nr:hypothetical protein [Paenibacillus sp. PvR133]